VGKRRGDAVFVGVLVALVAANVGLYLYLRPAGRPETRGPRAPGTSTEHHSAFKPPTPSRQSKHRRARRGGRSSADRVTIVAARGPSWVLVRRGSADGAIVYQGVARTGGTLRFSGRALYVRLGAVSNVDVRLDGQLLDVRCSAPGGVLVTEGVAVGVGQSACAPVGS
jgi:hypothetical protein